MKLPDFFGAGRRANKLADQRVSELLQSKTIRDNLLQNDIAANSNILNTVTGMGTAIDKSSSDRFVASSITNSFIGLETTYIESWALGKMIDIPINDIMSVPRIITSLDDDELEAFNAEERRLQIDALITQHLKNSRTFGTSLMSIIT